MIRFLHGSVHSKEDRTIILLVNGVGYQVYVPSSILAEENTELNLFIYSHIREDAFNLYGFRTKNKLNFFELLIGINGVGPKMAMLLLDQPVNMLKSAIVSENVAVLTKTPGVGKKIAERIILELKNKVDGLEVPVNHSSHQVNDDVVNALESLGYKRHHITKVLAEIGDEVTDTEVLIRSFLQRV